MKQIHPVQIWSNGQSKQALVLEARIVNDNLDSSCTFYYELKEAGINMPDTEEGPATIIPGTRLVDGNVALSGTDYDAWDGSNTSAYSFIANALNLTLVTGSTE